VMDSSMVCMVRALASLRQLSVATVARHAGGRIDGAFAHFTGFATAKH